MEALEASADRLHRTRGPTLEDVEGLLENARTLPVQLPEEAVLTMVLQQYKIWQVKRRAEKQQLLLMLLESH
jgi:hypothetical protein